MTTKHTPGPWVCDEAGLVNGRDSRARFAGSPSIDIFDASEWPAELHDEALANARLIAEAPAMVEALATILNVWDEHKIIGPTVYHDARAILARIEGE